MTYEEALHILNSSCCPQDTETTDYVYTLGEALKKQIPKKLIVTNDNSKYCPSCTIMIGDDVLRQIVGIEDKKCFLAARTADKAAKIKTPYISACSADGTYSKIKNMWGGIGHEN